MTMHNRAGLLLALLLLGARAEGSGFTADGNRLCAHLRLGPEETRIRAGNSFRIKVLALDSPQRREGANTEDPQRPRVFAVKLLGTSESGGHLPLACAARAAGNEEASSRVPTTCRSTL